MTISADIYQISNISIYTHNIYYKISIYYVSLSEEASRIPKDLLYGEVATYADTGKRPTGRSLLRFKDICKRDLMAICKRDLMTICKRDLMAICKRDLMALAISTDTWEALASDRCVWRQEV